MAREKIMHEQHMYGLAAHMLFMPIVIASLFGACIAQKTLGVTFTESGKGAGIQSGIIEKTSYATPATVSSILNNLGQAVAILEFTVKENGSRDGYPFEIKELRFTFTGTADPADLRFVLEGPGSNNTTASISGNTITFKDFGNIIVTDGDTTGKTYQLKGQIRSAVNGTTTDGQTIAVSFSPASDIDVVEASSNILPGNASMASGAMAVTILASELQGKGNFSFGTVNVSTIFPGTPAFYATDANGRVDKDYVTNVTLVSRQSDCAAAESGLGNPATGTNLTIAAVQGVATFTNLMFNTAAKTFKVYATSGTLTAQCTAAITTP
jgi:hypothetical protein